MPSRLVTRFFPAGALLFVACFGSGCVTYTLWSPKSLQYDNVAGTVPLSATAGSARALVIEYEFSGERSAVLIPLNADGSPQPPFAFQGKKQDAEGYRSKAADGQRAAICQAAAAHASALPATITPILSDRDCYCGRTEYFTEVDQQPNKLVAIFYGIDEKGRIVGLQSVNDVPKLPDGAAMVATYIAVVPRDQPRGQAGRDRDRNTAILLTPFTLILDGAIYVSLVPIVAVGVPLTILLGGMH